MSSARGADDQPTSRLDRAWRLRSRGLADLRFAASEERITDALHDLEHASALAPDDPKIWSDLAAAFLHVGVTSERPVVLVRGLEAALTATALPDPPPAARFNLALILDRLSLRSAAAEAWRRFLDAEPDTLWSEEARFYLQTLQVRTSRREPPIDAGRVTPEGLHSAGPGRESLLAKLRNRDPATTESAFRELWAHGREIEDLTGDRLFLDSLRVMHRAWREQGQKGLDDVLEGHRRLGVGYRAYQLGHLEEARSQFGSAWATLHAAGDPYASWAMFYDACALQQAERYRESLDHVLEIERSLGDRPYGTLRAFLAWMNGQNRILLGRPLEAISPFRQSLELFERSRLDDERATLHALLGDALLEMGREEEAWSEIVSGLALGADMVHPRRAAILYSIAADASLQYDRERAGAVFQAQALVAARATRNPKIQVLSLIAHGLQLLVLEDRDGARHALAEAERLLPNLDDRPSRLRAEADLALLRVAADAGGAPASALRKLDVTIARYERLGFQSPLAVAAYEARARVHRAAGDLEAAAADLATSLALYEGRIEHGAGSQLRWTLHLGARRTYDRLIALLLECDDAAGAFAVAERARFFSLHSFDFAAHRASLRSDLRPTDIQHVLAEHDVLVFWKILDQELVTWTVATTGTDVTRRPIDRSDLADLVRRFVMDVRAEEAADGSPAVAGRLAELLLPAGLEAGRGLVLIPDGFLEAVPFGALPIDDAGGHLLHQHTIVTAPSVQIFLNAERRQEAIGRRAATGSGKVLLVTRPTHDRELWPDLAPLPSSAAEGSAIAPLYESLVHLEGRNARSDRFVQESRDAAIIHFAGHALLHPVRPDRSGLVLAPDGDGDPGTLDQGEIYSLDLDAGPVVVLSACDTGTIAGTADEGFSSLSRAFLSAGATAVVASLWPVDDRATARLMTELHRHLATGIGPAEALRRAQLAFLGGEPSTAGAPRDWAAFQVIGATSEPHSPEGEDP